MKPVRGHSRGTRSVAYISYLKDSIRTMINVTVLIVTISLYLNIQGPLPIVMYWHRHSMIYIKSVNRVIAPIIY